MDEINLHDPKLAHSYIDTSFLCLISLDGPPPVSGINHSSVPPNNLPCDVVVDMDSCNIHAPFIVHRQVGVYSRRTNKRPLKRE